MLLTIDIGNTNIVLGIYKDKKLIRHFRIETKKIGTLPIFRKYPKIEDVVISSVVPSLNKVFAAIIKRELNKTPFFITNRVNLGLNIEVDAPSEVGADRLVNAVAGKILYGKPLIIIDFGTATTIDVVSEKGNYIGGIIAPGIELGANALNTFTAKLPMVKLVKPKKVIGKNTISCIQSGLIYGTIGTIEFFVKMIKKELKYNAKVIATGGLVNLIADKTNVINHVDEFLTLHGIRIVYELNK